MLSRKFWKGRRWSRTFYLQLRNPGSNLANENADVGRIKC